MELSGTLSFSISISLHHHPALSGGGVVLKAVRQEWWDKKQRGSLCTHLMPRRSSGGQPWRHTTPQPFLLLRQYTQTLDMVALCWRNWCWWVFMAQLHYSHLLVSLVAACRCVHYHQSVYSFIRALFNQEMPLWDDVSFTGGSLQSYKTYNSDLW